MDVIIGPKARSDIASILAWTEENFGPQTLKRYGNLLATAIEQVAANPDLPGSSARTEIAENCRTYHLLFSRKAAGKAGDRIHRPRHFLLYRVTESFVEIGRVLHDSMELAAHVPEEYRGLPGVGFPRERCDGYVGLCYKYRLHVRDISRVHQREIPS